ncbi:MAG: FtsX-like permease family protein [Candidatus Hodarchaeota archaeon]
MRIVPGFIRDYFAEYNRNIVITALGLIFIVAIMTVTVTSEVSVKAQYIKESLGYENSTIPFQIIGSDESWEFNYSSYRKTMIMEFTKIVDKNEVIEYFHDDGLTSISFSIWVRKEQDQEILPYKAEFGLLDGDIQKLLSSSSNFEGRAPVKNNEVLYVKGLGGTGDEDYSPLRAFELDIRLGQQINISRSGYEYDDQQQQWIYGKEYNLTTEIVGIYHTEIVAIEKELSGEWIGSKKLLKDNLILNNPILTPGAFYTTDYELFSILTKSLHGSNPIEYFVRHQYTLELSKAIRPNIFRKAATTFERFFEDFYWVSKYNLKRYDLYWSGEGYHLSLFTKISGLEVIKKELDASRFTNVLLAIPALSITIFYFSFSTNMFFDRRLDQVELLRVRGVTRRQLLIILIIEGAISSILALIFGYLMGIFLVSSTVRSKTFLNFQISFDVTFISVNTLLQVLLMTFFVILWMIFSRIIRLNRLDVSETRNLVDKTPFWQRAHLDVILIILAFLGNIFFLMMILSPQVMWEIDPETATLHILTLLFSPFPFILLLGGLLLLSRIVPPVINIVSQKIWRVAENFFAYSMMNVVRHKESAIRTILLISLLFSLEWAMFTIPPVVETHVARTTYYQIGADAYYQQWWNTTIEEILSNDPNIEAFTSIGSYSHRDSRGLAIDLFIISENFLDIVYWESGFGSRQAIKDLFKLNEGLYHYGLMSKRGLTITGKEIGDILTLRYITASDNHNLTVAGTFSYCPRLVTKPPELYNHPQMIITKKTINAMLNKGIITYITDVEQGYYLKLAQNANITLLKETYGINDVLYAADDISESTSSLLYQLLWIQLNILFIISFITIILVIIFYYYKQAKGRSREFGIYVSLGLRKFQLIKLFVYETIVILGFSYVFGGILGSIFTLTYVSLMIMPLAKYSMPLPQPIIFYPLEVINLILGVMIIISVITAVITAWNVSKTDIVSSLRVY